MANDPRSVVLGLMATDPQGAYMTGTEADPTSSTLMSEKSLKPSSLSEVLPDFLQTYSTDGHTSGDRDPITGKGKGKRPASETSPPSPQKNTRNIHAIPRVNVVSRKHHRRHVVAATVWGPQLPMAPHNAPGLPFNVYKALLRHPNLFFQFAIRLDTDSLVDLYAIDKEFHFRFNKYSVSIIAEHASYHVREAAFIFSWIFFPELCISDPMLRPMDGRPHLARDIPSLRWVKMLLFRDDIVRNILDDLAEHGLRVSPGTKPALMKFWLLMQLKRQAMRAAFLADKSVWSDADLLAILHFAVKLDMRLINPVLGNGMCALSHMMLTQKTLTKLHDLLSGKLVMDYDDAADMLVRTYPSDDLDTDTHPWLEDEVDNGIGWNEIGMLCHEDWHRDGEPLDPVLDMVTLEAVNRKLQPQGYLLEWTLYGFVDENTGANIPAPRGWGWGEDGNEEKMHLPEEAWPGEVERMALIKKLDDRVDVEKLRAPNLPPLVFITRPPDGVLQMFELSFQASVISMTP